MKPAVDLAGLKKPRVWEYALRFLFGGSITVATGLLAHAFGPSIGGLFLAFPAILPASITLTKEHDGRKQATDDARGARLGAVGTVLFAATALALHRSSPIVALTAGTLGWLLGCCMLWSVVYGRGHREFCRYERPLLTRTVRGRADVTKDAAVERKGEADRAGLHRE